MIIVINHYIIISINDNDNDNRDSGDTFRQRHTSLCLPVRVYKFGVLRGNQDVEEGGVLFFLVLRKTVEFVVGA